MVEPAVFIRRLQGHDRNLHCAARFWVAAHARLTAVATETAKAPQLHCVARPQRVYNALQETGTHRSRLVFRELDAFGVMITQSGGRWEIFRLAAWFSLLDRQHGGGDA